MKIAFQNVRSISDEKTRVLSSKLKDYDLLCLSELNKCYDFSKKTINDSEFQYHTDVTTNRIGVIASNTLKLETVHMGVLVEQPRAQIDKNSIQTFIYKIKLNNRDVYIENVYSIPKASDENVKVLTNHMENQSKLFKYYMIGGDFNLNWREKCNRDLFKDTCMSQLVKDYTRVQNYYRDNRKRVSKSIIDLIFVNDNLKQFVKNVEVVQLYDKFDHKSVTVELDFPPSKFLRNIKIPLDPLQRPKLKPQNIDEIKEKIKQMKPTDLHSLCR